jgi:glycerol-3-phosphate acyltransferase PlsY
MTIAFVAIAYLIGSVSFAVLVSRGFGLPDPRSYGSSNPGATNVLRSGRKTAAILTLIGDTAKGWIAVALAWHFVPDQNVAVVAAAAGLAVVIGHMYPLFFGFRGGKGVSTALGALFGFSPWLGLATLVTWLIIAFFFRLSSLAALVSCLFAPFFCFLLFGLHAFTWSVIAMALLLVWRHRNNIRNLLAGTEGRIGERNTGTPGG